MTINNRSDFKLLICLRDNITQEPIELPNSRFRMELYIKEGLSFSPKVLVWSDDPNVVRAADNRSLSVAIHFEPDNYLPDGTLLCRFCFSEADSQYLGGRCDTQKPTDTGVTIWPGATDFEGAVTIDSIYNYFKGEPGKKGEPGPQGPPPPLVQAPGDSQADAMSQAATTEAIAEAVAAIPTPDVSGQISEHDGSRGAHSDIREMVASEQRRAESAEQTLSESIDKAAAAALSGAKIYTDEAVAAIPTPDVSGQISDHNAAEDAHADIRQQVGKKENAPIIEQIAGAVATLDVVGGHTYICEELTSLTLSMVEDSPREAVIRFRSGAAATSLSIPLALRTSGYWAITANKSYEISIAGNLAVLAAFE